MKNTYALFKTSKTRLSNNKNRAFPYEGKDKQYLCDPWSKRALKNNEVVSRVGPKTAKNIRLVSTQAGRA